MIQMLSSTSGNGIPAVGRNSGVSLQNYLSHNEKLILARQQSISDLQYRRQYDDDYAQVLKSSVASGGR